jgi:hypothetical protein
MKDLIENILNLAKVKGATYADLRIVRRRQEEVALKNGNVEALTSDEDFGVGIRVLFQGAWGFACSAKVTRKEMEAVFGKALKISRASSGAKDRGMDYQVWCGPAIGAFNDFIHGSYLDYSSNGGMYPCVVQCNLQLFKGASYLKRNGGMYSPDAEII